MAYCTEDQVRSSLGGIEVVELSQADILEAIDESTSYIDAFIGIKYVLPIPDPAPPLLTRIARTLCACWLNDDAIAKGIEYIDSGKAKSRCDRANMSLEMIRTGKMKLINLDGTDVGTIDGGAKQAWSNSNDYKHPQFFDKDSEFDWGFDSDELDDITSNRGN